MPDAPVILVLDRNRRNLELLTRFLGEAGYDLAGASNLDDFDSLLEQPRPFGLALIDLGGLDRRIWKHCEKLRKQGIPFILIAHQQSTALEEAGKSAGARDVLVKPLSSRSLLGAIQSLLRK